MSTAKRAKPAARKPAAAEQQQLGRACEAELATFRQYFDLAATILVSLDPKGTILAANRETCRVLGLEKEAEIIGKNWFENFIPEKIRGPLAGHQRHLIAKKVRSDEHTNVIVTRKGEERLIAWRNTTVKGAGGRAMMTISAGRDITEETEIRHKLEIHSRALDLIGESVFIHDLDGDIIFVSRQACLERGWKPGELVGRNFCADVDVPESAALVKTRVKELLRTGESAFEVWHRRRDGSVFPASVHARTMELDGRTVIISAVRDVSDLRRSEDETVAKNRALLMANRCAEATARATDERSLLQEICEIVCRDGGYDLAWVGRKAAETDTRIDIASAAGPKKDYTRGLRVSWGDDEGGQTPIGRALRKGKTVIANDLAKQAVFKPWRERVIKFDLKADLAVPLTIDGKTELALTVYSSHSDPFNKYEVELLERLGQNLAFGIKTIRERRARLDAENKQKELAEKYGFILANTNDIFFWVAKNGKIISVGQGVERYGLDAEKMVGRNFLEYCWKEDRSMVIKDFFSLLRDGKKHALRWRIKDGRGQPVWMETVTQIVVSSDKRGPAVVGVLRDITEQLAAEAARAKSEQLYRDLIENTTDVIYSTDLEGKITYISPQIANFGFDPNTIPGRKFLEFIHPEDRDQVTKGFLLQITPGHEGIYPASEFRVVNPAGSIIWVEERGRSTIDQKRGAIGIFGIMRDITERKLGEVALSRRTAAEKLISDISTEFLRSAPEEFDKTVRSALVRLAAATDSDCCKIYLISGDSRRLIERHGVDKDDPSRHDARELEISAYPWTASHFNRRDVAEITDIDDLPAGARSEVRNLCDERSTSAIFAPVLAGYRVLGVIGFSTLRGPQHWASDARSLLKMFTDIYANAYVRQETDQKRARRLQAEKIMIEVSRDLAAADDHQATIPAALKRLAEFASADQACLGILGQDPDTVSWIHGFHGQGSQPIDRAAKTVICRDSWLLEQIKNGEAVILSDLKTVPRAATDPCLAVRPEIRSAAATPIVQNGRPIGFIGLYSSRAPNYWGEDSIFLAADISRTISDTLDKATAHAKVREADALRRKFVQIVSHQLRTPLTAIRWNLEALLADEIGQMKPEHKSIVRLAHESEVEVIRRLGQMLTALDIEEGRVILSPEIMALDALLDSVRSMIAPRCIVRELALEHLSPGGPLPPVKADPEKIREVLLTLLDNAVAYTKNGGRLETSFELVGGRIRFSIKDTGVGIPQAEQSRIFARFYRASNAATMMPDASGLSLSIAKYYIEQHGGQIGFESKEGAGSTFWFELPVGGGVDEPVPAGRY